MSDEHEVTELLVAWGDGDAAALEELMPLIAGELRRMASYHFRGASDAGTLQPTALINELYLRLAGRDDLNWESRSHFFGFAAQVMRRIVIDHYRSKTSAKRGGGAAQVVFDDRLLATPDRGVDLLRLDDALNELEVVDQRQSKVVELRFFAGLTLDETSEVMELSRSTVKREWKTAKAWLYRQLHQA